MPKFMTYQRPTPVNKSAWGGGKAGGNPYQPARRSPAPPIPDQSAAQVLPALPRSPNRAK